MQVDTPIKEIYKFSFEIRNNALAPFTHLKIFNGSNEIVYHGYGNCGVDLAKGLYTLRIELNEYVEDRHYRITKDLKDYISKFRLSSSIPIKGFSSTRTEFALSAQKWSNFSTSTSKINSGNIFFLFISFLKEPVKTNLDDMIVQWKVLDGSRRPIQSLDRNNTKKTSAKDKKEKFSTGTICFSGNMAVGQYFLLYQSEGLNREIPFFIFQNFQTQMFIRFASKPLFATLRISISRDCFNCADEGNIYLEALTTKIHNGLYVLPEKLKNAAAFGKFANPMLAILASYMYLMTSENREDDLFDTILNNLEYNILLNHDAPDLLALKLLRTKHAAAEPKPQTISQPCMVNLGMSIILEHSNLNPLTIELSDEMENIFPQLQKDSIWTTYEPLVIAEVAKPNQETFIKTNNKLLMDFGKVIWKNILNDEQSLNLSLILPKSETSPTDWVSSSILSQLSSNGGDPKSLNIDTLANQLQVSSKMIRSKLDLIQKDENLKIMASEILGTISKNAMDKLLHRLNGSIESLINPKIK